MNELVFKVTAEADGGYVAEGNDWAELRANVLEAVKTFHFDRPAPNKIRLHMVRDEVLAMA